MLKKTVRIPDISELPDHQTQTGTADARLNIHVPTTSMP